MVRTTRTSAAVKNSTLASGSSSSSSSGDSSDNKGEAPPPTEEGDVATAGATPVEDSGEGGGTSVNIEELTLSPKLRASVVLEKLPMEGINAGPSTGPGSARKGARGRKVSWHRFGWCGIAMKRSPLFQKSIGQPRATRSQQRSQASSSAGEEKEDSNDDGLVELIEIVDEDSKSHEGSNKAPSEVSESTTMAMEEEQEDSKDTKMEIDKESKEDLIQVGAYTVFIIHNSLFEHYIETVILFLFPDRQKIR